MPLPLWNAGHSASGIRTFSACLERHVSLFLPPTSPCRLPIRLHSFLGYHGQGDDFSLFRRKGKIKAYPPTLNDNGRIARRLQDERGWEMPLEGMDPLGDPLTSPACLGIKDWSEWYPCPGTRLRMMWDLFPSTAPSGKSERSESCRKGYGL